MTKVCIATTFRNSQETFKTFLEYHYSIGFEHIFAFIDDVKEYDFYAQYQSDNLTLIKYDKYLINSWLKTYSLKKYFRYVNKEVMARQALNVEVAINIARVNKYDWLMHIDSDELFYINSVGMSVSDYFNTKSNFSNIYFLNNEAVPETLSINNFFEEVSLFKLNYSFLNAAQKQLVDEVFNSEKDYFKFYANGKSACKLNNYVCSRGVHRFSNNDYEVLQLDASILHFSCCGVNHFIKKYTTLGNFEDKWFGKFDIGSELPFHKLSRDVVLDSLHSVKDYYVRTFIEQCAGHTNELIQSGVLSRFNLQRCC